MNKKGFTLTELLAVIAIIGIISLIAIPNVTNISDSIKSNNMLNDAKRFISLAKLEINSDYTKRNFTSEDKNSDDAIICDVNTSSCTFYIKDLNKNGDFKSNVFDGERKIVDPDGLGYSNSSYVRYYKVSNTLKYCIHLVSEKRYLAPIDVNSVNNAGCINEEDLTSKQIVHVK